MSEEAKVFESWSDVIKNFISQREIRKIEDLLAKKDSTKVENNERQAIIIQLVHALANEPTIDKESVEEIITRKNSGKNKIDTLDFHEKKYKDLFSLCQSSNSILKINNLYKQRREEIEKFHTPSNWVSYYAEKAEGVSFATHVAKITHSSINQVPSFYIKNDTGQHYYITTDNISNPETDEAIDNAALTPIATFLKLEFKGESIASLIADNNPQALSCIAENNYQVKVWLKQFSKVFLAKEPKSHALQKQVFFPIKEKNVNEHHLLCIIQSSSMAHYLFSHLVNYKKNQNKKQYSDEVDISFPNKAKLSLTATKKAHTNVSPLHAKRDGNIYLLSTQPPTWQSQLKAPIYKKSLFDYFGNSHITEEVNYLREFLLRFENIGLSIKDPKRYKHLERWVNSLIDEVLFYSSSIQAMPAGWSNTKDIKLKSEHQYFLDPYRDDKNFQDKREASDWQTVVSNDFARWLNQKLKGKDKQFTPQAEHTRLWKKIFDAPLREDSEAIKADAKYSQQKDKV